MLPSGIVTLFKLFFFWLCIYLIFLLLGLINPNCVALIGNGVVVHLPSFFEEKAKLEAKGKVERVGKNLKKRKKKKKPQKIFLIFIKNFQFLLGLDCEGRLLLSDRAHLVFDLHQMVDGFKEIELGRGSIGTTGKGIGPTYSSKATRSGIRVHHLYDFDEFTARFKTMVANKRKRYGNFEYDVEAELARYKELAERVRPYVIDTIPYLHQQIKAGKRVLVEGANALMLDIDFGTYPYVTSSNTSIGGVATGLGVPVNKITNIIGVVKAYCTRVGGGPFPSEQLNSIGEHLQTVGFEVGVTTGRKRRCGWLDLVVVKYSHMVNGYTSFNLTKLDILDQLPKIKVAVAYHLDGKKLDSFPACLELLSKVEVEYAELDGWMTDISKVTKYEDLPENAKKYIAFIEKETEVPIEWIGVGPGREAMIHKPVPN